MCERGFVEETHRSDLLVVWFCGVEPTVLEQGSVRIAKVQKRRRSSGTARFYIGGDVLHLERFQSNHPNERSALAAVYPEQSADNHLFLLLE